MNETLNEILKKMLDSVDAGISFLQKEIPEEVSQLLLWHLVEHLIYFAIGIVSIVFALIGARFTWKLMDKHSEAMFLFLPVMAFGVVGVAMLFHNVVWIKILIAPKLYLLEYAASIIK